VRLARFYLLGVRLLTERQFHWSYATVRFVKHTVVFLSPLTSAFDRLRVPPPAPLLKWERGEEMNYGNCTYSLNLF